MQVPFEQGIQQTIQWYKDNSAWVESIRTGAYREAQLKHTRSA